jgi:hypothetical protein
MKRTLLCLTSKAKYLIYTLTLAFCLTESISVSHAQNASLQFDGTDDYVSLGNILNSIESMSFSAWIRRTGNNGVGMDQILSKEYTVNFAINNTTGNLHLNFGNGSSWGTGVESSAPVPMNQWVYVTGTRDSRDGSVKVYIDGVLSGSGFNNLSGNYTGDVCIGHRAGAPDVQNAFEGNIDELRIWTKMLCPGEIAQYKTFEFTTDFDQLYACYNFNQGTPAGSNASATSLTDITQYAHTGTLANFGLASTTSNWDNGCSQLSGTGTVYIMPNAAFTSSAGTSICAGSSTIFTAQQAALTYDWSTGANTQNITISAAGKYSLTVTDGNGCSAKSTPVNVTLLPAYTITSGTYFSGSPTFCKGLNQNLVVRVIYTPSASKSFTVQLSTDSNFSTTTYSLAATLTSGAGNITIPSTVVRTWNTGTYYARLTSTCLTNNNYRLPNIIVQQAFTVSPSTNSPICQGDMLNMSANTGGNSYTWSGPGSFSGAGRTASMNSENMSSGLYTCSATNACGTYSGSANVMITPHPIVASLTTSAICPGSTNGTITVVATGLSLQYTLNNGPTQLLPIFTNLSPATYSVGITSLLTGCAYSVPATVGGTDVTAPLALAKNLSVILDPAGHASITASQINNGSTDNCGISSVTVSPATFSVSNVGANTVTLSVTDLGGNISTATATVTVIDNTPPVVVPKNIVKEMDANGSVTVLPSELVTSATDASGIASITTNMSTFDCSKEGVNTVQVTVTDNNGNNTVVVATVTVEDHIAPQVVTQNISLELNANGTASITPANANNGSSDACGIASSSLSKTNFSCADIGANTVVFTVTDVHGNTSSANVIVTVADDIAPEVITQDVTVYMDLAGNASVTAQQVNNGSSDVCGIASVTVSPNTFTLAEAGANIVMVTVTDVNGNSSQGAAVVWVSDNIPPTAITQNANIILNANGTAVINASQLDNGSYDLTGIAGITSSITSFDCSHVGTNTVLVTVTDNFGNIASAPANVTVSDNTAPVAVAHNITVPLVSNGTALINAESVNNGSSDACGIVSYSLDKTSFDCSNAGVNNVVLTVTDAHGNSSTATAEVTITDITPPTALAKDIAIFLDGAGNASITAAMINDGSSDVCGIASVSVSPETFTTANTGANTVTLTVTDIHGNVTTATAVVTVGDNIPPTIGTNPAAVVVQLLEGGVGHLSAPDIENGSYDASGIANISLSKTVFNCADRGLQIVTYTVTDVYGNSASVPVTVTVRDALAPVVVAKNISIVPGTTITPSDVTSQLADDCGLFQVTLDRSTFTTADIGVNQVTIEAIDNDGNIQSAIASVTVLDNIAPTVFTQGITVDLDLSGTAVITAAQIDNGSNDASGIATLSLDKTGFNCSEVGSNSVMLTVTDIYGNSASAPATVTVRDIIAPSASVQPLTVSLSAEGTAVVSAEMLNNGSADNCGIATMSIDKTIFDCFNTGVNAINFTVTDNHGNTVSVPASVTIADNTAPSALAHDITVYLDAAGNASITAAMINNGSFDACGIASMSVSPETFSAANAGTNLVTLTVTDIHGNVSNTTAIVTVLDNTAPTVLAKNAAVTLNAAGNATVSASQLNDGSWDASGIAAIVADQTNFTCADIGTQTVTLTATDIFGNSASVTATVTVTDATAPQVVTQNVNITVLATGSVSITTADVNNGSSDVCGIASMALSKSSFTAADMGSNTVTLTVTDVNGNTALAPATVIVTVLDNIPPTVLTHNITLALDASGAANITVGQVDNGTNDASGLSTIILSKVQFNCSNVGANTVMLTATDIYGNTASAPAIVTVTDVTAPTVLTQNMTVTVNSTSGVTVLASAISNGSSDACGIASMSLSKTSFTMADLGANTVTLTVTDVHGNSATATAVVTVQDGVAPTVLTKNITVALNAAGTATITAADVNNGTTDASGIASMTLSKTTFNCSNKGANTVVLTVVDGLGNTGSAPATVTITDITAPTVITQNITVTVGASGTENITTARINNGSTDACGIASMSLSKTSFTMANLGNNTVTLTVTDVNGNVGTGTAVVSVRESIPPTVLTKNISVSLNASGAASILATQVNNGSTDAGGIATMTVSPSTFNCSNIGNNTVTLTVTDNYGNAASKTAVVTISDVTPPTVITQNVTIRVGATGSVTVAASAINNGSFDACGIASLSLSKTSFTIANLGNNTVTLTVKDAKGNTATGTAIVTVLDNVPPTVITKNITVALNATGTATITASQVNNGSTDATGIASMTLNKTTFNCANLGTNTVILTVTDNSGNSASANAVVTITDNTAPVAIAKNITVNLVNGAAAITAADVNNNSTDNCSIASMSINKTSFTCTNIGANAVILTVTDSKGNSAQSTCTVTVAGAAAPVITAPAIYISQSNKIGWVNIPGVTDGQSSEITNASSTSFNGGQLSIKSTGGHITTSACTGLGVLGGSAAGCSGNNTAYFNATVNKNQTITFTLNNANVGITAVAFSSAYSAKVLVIGKRNNQKVISFSKYMTANIVDTFDFTSACMLRGLGIVDEVEFQLSDKTTGCRRWWDFYCDRAAEEFDFEDGTNCSNNCGFTMNAPVILLRAKEACDPGTISYSSSSGVFASRVVAMSQNLSVLPSVEHSLGVNSDGNFTGGTPFVSNYAKRIVVGYNWLGLASAWEVTNNCDARNVRRGQADYIEILPVGDLLNLLYYQYTVTSVDSNGQYIYGKRISRSTGASVDIKWRVNEYYQRVWISDCVEVGFSKTGSTEERIETGPSTTVEQVKQYNDLDVMVYPNPSSDIFKFRIESSSNEPVSIELYDMAGRMVMQQGNFAAQQEILIGNELTAGVYTAHVKQGSGIKVIKITKTN